MTTPKLGKLPAREGAYKFKLASFLGAATLPKPPVVFGHTDLLSELGMLANDRFGDCVFAGGDHETMLWTTMAGKKATFVDANALSDYSAVTGFNPNEPGTDQGTDMEAAAKYRRKTGLVDSKNIRHKVDAYLELPGVSARGSNNPQLLDAIASAAYVFGAVGIGVEFPGSAMDQFNARRPWTVVNGAQIEGGHYVPLVGRRANGNFVVITWGEFQEVTPEFLLKYVDEAIVYVSLESLKDGKTLDGFNVAGLQAALSALGGGVIPTPSPTPAPTPVPVTDGHIKVLDAWAASRHVGQNAAAAKAWKAVKADHNL